MANHGFRIFSAVFEPMTNLTLLTQRTIFTVRNLSACWLRMTRGLASRIVRNRPRVVESIRKLVACADYPERLWARNEIET